MVHLEIVDRMDSLDHLAALDSRVLRVLVGSQDSLDLVESLELEDRLEREVHLDLLGKLVRENTNIISFRSQANHQLW